MRVSKFLEQMPKGGFDDDDPIVPVWREFQVWPEDGYRYYSYGLALNADDAERHLYRNAGVTRVIRSSVSDELAAQLESLVSMADRIEAGHSPDGCSGEFLALSKPGGTLVHAWGEDA